MKKAALRYAEILEKGAWVTHQEQDEIAKLLRSLAMTEDEAWDELEARLHKNNAFAQPFTPDWDTIEPYHERIKELEIENEKLRQALAQPEQEPVAKVVLTDTIGLSLLRWLDLDRQFDFKGGEFLYTAPPSKPWIGLENIDFQYQPPAEVITMKYAEAILKEKNT